MKQSISNSCFSLTLVSLVISLAMISISHGYSLSWNANTEEDLAGYKVYSVTSPLNYKLILDVGKVTERELSELYLHEDTDYYIAVTAYDTSGNESAHSSEIYFFAEDYVSDSEDNCPDIYNPFQEDNYPQGGNGIGDACECEADFDCDGDVDADDTGLFEDFGRNIYNDPCSDGNPCNGDFDCDGDVDGADVAKLKEDIGRNLYYHPCPACAEGDWCTY